ncbi:50S ribosomal protein L25/general stress protein Ctc [Glycocaulis profundi]|nr:50S ribosomal protein L25/general stress protein Ctc [Glycocaulis profundi]
MSDIVVSVEVRERTGKGGAREARRQGFVPGVLYGGDRGPVAIALKQNELVKAINSGNLIANMIKIDHKGEQQSVLTRDIQFHPVTDMPEHIDFYRVDEDSVVEVAVPVHFINEEKSPGLKKGGALNVVRHEIEVSCPAGQIPNEIVVDLEGLDIGESVHISSVKLPDNVTPVIDDRDFTIATLQAPRAMVEETEEPEEPADPEVINQKDDGEEAEASEGEGDDKE